MRRLLITTALVTTTIRRPPKSGICSSQALSPRSALRFTLHR
jgi:hypothetical protein